MHSNTHTHSQNICVYTFAVTEQAEGAGPDLAELDAAPASRMEVRVCLCVSVCLCLIYYSMFCVLPDLAELDAALAS